MALTLADLLASPDHYLHSFEDEAAVFVPMSRAAYHRSIFLDARISPERDGAARIPLDAFTGHVPRPQRTCWIFHVAHCGSTLLARGLDQPATNLILREPLALRQAALAPDLDAGRMALVAAMLSKRYRAELPTIVKANVPVNFLLPRLAALDTTAPAIFLYLELEDYLLAILRSSDHRAWLRRVTHQLADHLGHLDDRSDAERAAALWLAQVRAYTSALVTLPLGRSLDAERFFADPEAVLRAAAVHFDVPVDAATVRTITQGPLFASYSKDPARAFDNAARVARRQTLMPSLQSELGQARAWLERRGADAGSVLEKLKAASLLA